ncbi:MAG: sulfotransferase family protein [Alphaproteobacteria bacterium]|nr:sulfotransferase family protein [Alphaproteobacteria bacterium]
MAQRQLLFVFGMSRSGTSALTRVLSLCGAALPGIQLRANPHNPKGHFEPVDALVLNDEFLFHHGTSLFDPTLRLQGETKFEVSERDSFVGKIRQFLREKGNSPLTVVKDPRIVGISDFWFEAARQEGFSVKLVIPLRHCSEVAASLAARDQASPELSTLLWLKNNLLAERCSRPFPRVFVEYRNLLADWRAEIRRISEALTIELQASDEAAIDGFLDPALYRQKSPDAIANVLDPSWTERVYAAFASAARGGPIDTAEMDMILLAYRRFERTFRVAAEEFHARFGPRPWALPPIAPS